MEKCNTTKKCNSACCSMGSMVVLILILIISGVNLVMNFMSPDANVEKAVKNALVEMEVQRAGGQEAYDLVQKMYANKEFQKAQKERMEEIMQQIENGPTAAPTQASNTPQTLDADTLAKVTENLVVQGDENAPILIVEYSDLECPFCKNHHKNGTIKQAVENNDGKVKAVLKHFPLTQIHPNAQHSAEAIECAKDQTDATTLYEFVGDLFDADDLTVDNIVKIAGTRDLNTDTLKACIDNGEKTEIVQAQFTEGKNIFGVTGTPGNIVLNTETGQWIAVNGMQPYQAFQAAIDQLLNN